MQDTELEALARRAFPKANRIIILDAGNPGGTLFHDANAEFQAAGIAATSWDQTTRVLYLRRLPPGSAPQPAPPAPMRPV
ncbi:MAG: hypothetical protein M3R24_33460 [Chloroflexota bacterium]|nr:hypothetical protein [Chloroflexota bacterium]